MAKTSLSSIFGRFSRRKVGPTQTAGVRGVNIVGGFIDEDELNKDLRGTERYKTYSDLLANTSIVAAGTRYFLNLVAKSSWTFVPSDADTDGKFAEMTEQALTDDPITPWHRIVRRAAMYRFYGFSIQEWTAKRSAEGFLTFKDVAPRAQLTIERWEVDDSGLVEGMVQVDPKSQREIFLPRQKVVYMVDDTLSDSPEGLGIFRHLAQPGQHLKRYEQLEGYGFETDLRGIPVARGPFTDLAEMVTAGTITKEERTAIELPMRTFIEKHVKTPALGLLLDSITYMSEDDAGTPSSVRKWDVELLKGSNTTQEQIASTIARLNQEMARIMGTEGLLVGGGGVGSLALSKDKTNNLFMLVDGALLEIAEQFDDDLLDTLFKINGWPPEMKPSLEHEAVQFKDVEAIAAALRDMAAAGAILDVDDPAIGEVRELLGLSRPITSDLANANDASLSSNRQTNEPDEDTLPEDLDEE